MLICILTKNVITSCSVTMMLFLHLEVKPLMTLTTVLYLSCALISVHLALLCFLEKGHTSKAGTFRAHVERLISFLESELVRSLSYGRQISVDKIIKLARSGRAFPGDWCELASEPLRGSSTKEIWARIDN